MSNYKIHVHAVGDTVWIIGDDKKIISLKVAHQEWWSANKDTPVYYDLVDDNGQSVGSGDGAGNFHFQEVWKTKEEAVQYYLHSGLFEGEPEVC